MKRFQNLFTQLIDVTKLFDYALTPTLLRDKIPFLVLVLQVELVKYS